jgi:hypothetical protein
LSTIEVEYMVDTHSCKEAILIMKLCSDVGLSHRVIKNQCDSNGTIFFSKTPNFHANTNHIDIYHYSIGDMVENGKVILEKVNNLLDFADALKKLVSMDTFMWCCDNMGPMTPKNYLGV